METTGTAPPQAFLLHFAGGNRYSFNFMQPHFYDVEFIPIELPGRGKRMKERLLNNYDAAVQDVCSQVMQLRTSGPFLLYGHSLGAALALSATARLEGIDMRPAALVVSGHAGPGANNHRHKHRLSRQALKAELKGASQEFLQSDELFDFYEPILRADFSLADCPSFSFFAKVQAPIYALVGSRESFAGRVDSWRQCTTASFRSEVLEGDHFFIRQHAARVSGIIRSCLLQGDKMF